MSTQDAPMAIPETIPAWAKAFATECRDASVGDGCWANDLFPVDGRVVNYRKGQKQ